jgi:hypothetical protein
MMHDHLPTSPIINQAFCEKGIPDVVKFDVVEIQNEQVVKLVFISRNSIWRQGVWLKTDDGIVVNNQIVPSAQIWMDSAPKEIVMQCRTRNKKLYLYNIWDKGSGAESQSWSSGMLIQLISSTRNYGCNDIGFDTQFDKLVFRLEFPRK